jgi:hypothetical protein
MVEEAGVDVVPPFGAQCAAVNIAGTELIAQAKPDVHVPAGTFILAPPQNGEVSV